MLFFASPKKEVDIRKECVKMHQKNVSFSHFFTAPQTEKIRRRSSTKLRGLSIITRIQFQFSIL